MDISMSIDATWLKPERLDLPDNVMDAAAEARHKTRSDEPRNPARAGRQASNDYCHE